VGGIVDLNTLEQAAGKHLYKLCIEIPTRRVGSRGNQDATKYFRKTMGDLGFTTEIQPFDCVDLQQGEISLKSGEKGFEAHISPYSLGCDLTAELVCASNLEELQSLEAKGKILLLKDDLTKEQLMPKNFIFYNPESHQQIYRLLEVKQSAAIVAATGRNPELAGASYPFPLIEDGDFDIPSAFMTDFEGEELACFAGKTVALKMDAQRIPSSAENVIARKGPAEGKYVVICAHIDAKAGTPGAVDNASGIVTLMLLAELLQDYQSEMAVEIIALNGEDYYSAGGEMAYLKAKQEKFRSIITAINLDGLGYKGFSTTISFFNCPQVIEKQSRALITKYPSLLIGEPWYQSDHMVFVMNQVPAIAITTAAFVEMETAIAHTEKDKPDLVDMHLLAETALFLGDLLSHLNMD